MDHSIEATEFPCGMYGAAEERANRVTHGFGFLLSVVGTIYLFTTMSAPVDWGRVIACAIYTASLMAVYAADPLNRSPAW